jgi:hypothetical protein
MNKLTKDYGVFGDHGRGHEELLFETNSVDEAIDWADSYTRWGNFGGYDVIEVGFFTRRGEYETTWKMNAPEEQLIDELY